LLEGRRRDPSLFSGTGHMDCGITHRGRHKACPDTYPHGIGSSADNSAPLG